MDGMFHDARSDDRVTAQWSVHRTEISHQRRRERKGGKERSWNILLRLASYELANVEEKQTS